MASDLSIAHAATMLPINDIGERLGIPLEHLVPYGHTKAKVKLDYVQSLDDKPDGKLILVTAMSPTPAGEGKTTVAIGLTDAMELWILFLVASVLSGVRSARRGTQVPVVGHPVLVGIGLGRSTSVRVHTLPRGGVRALVGQVGHAVCICICIFLRKYGRDILVRGHGNDQWVGVPAGSP